MGGKGSYWSQVSHRVETFHLGCFHFGWYCQRRSVKDLLLFSTSFQKRLKKVTIAIILHLIISTLQLNLKHSLDVFNFRQNLNDFCSIVGIKWDFYLIKLRIQFLASSLAVFQFLNTHAFLLSIFKTRLYFLKEGRGILSQVSPFLRRRWCVILAWLLHHADNQRTIWAPISIIHRENHFLIASIRSIIHSVARSLMVTW